MRSFVIVGIGRGAVRTCRRAFSSDGATGLVVRRTRRRAFSSDGATGLVAGTKSGEQWGEQGVQCTAAIDYMDYITELSKCCWCEVL